MYKSTHIKYNKLSNFGLLGEIGARLLSDEPGEVIDTFKSLGSIKKKFDKPIGNPTWSQRLDSLANDVGAATGVLTSAAGAGLNKAGKFLKAKGVDTVIDDTKRLNTGKNVLAGGAILGGTGLGVGGIYAGSKLLDRYNEAPEYEELEYIEYARPKWKSSDFKYKNHIYANLSLYN